MTADPSLTVAVLTYNRAAYLTEALAAILVQTYRDFELLVLDNASTDNTAEVVGAFADPRIRYVRHEKNVGGPGNYNAALDLCTSPLLLITHDDDRMKPEMVQRQVEAFAADPLVNLVCCEVDLIDAEGKVKQVRHYAPMFAAGQPEDIGPREFLEAYFQGRNFICCPTVMLRMAPIRQHRLSFRPEIGPAIDSMFWMELNTLPGRFRFLPEPLYHYRIHDGQDSVLRADQIVLGLRKPVLELVNRQKDPRLIRLARRYFSRRVEKNLPRLVEPCGTDRSAIDALSAKVLTAHDPWLAFRLRAHRAMPGILLSYVAALRWLRRRAKTLLKRP